MNDFLQLCRLRRSVRSYQAREIPEDVMAYIEECTRWAPSAVNRQPWRFYVVRDTATLSLLHPCYDREWFREAPVCVVACRLTDEEWHRPADQKAHGDIDVAIAVEHLCLAAAEKGIGTCWVCNFDVEQCRQALRLPENAVPVALIPMGYPGPATPAPGKRKEIAETWEERHAAPKA